MRELFDDFISLERSITEALIQCCSEHAGDVQVILALGRLIGTDNRDPILLPIASNCLLEQSKDYAFVEAVQNSTLEILYTQLLPSAHEIWRIEGNEEVSIMEYYFNDESTVAVQMLDNLNEDNDEDLLSGSKVKGQKCDEQGMTKSSIQYVRISRLGELHICRPQSDLHIRISFVARRPISSLAEAENSEQNQQVKQNISRAVRRRLASWQFLPLHDDGPDWVLTTSESYELNPPSTIQEVTKSWFESAEDGIEPLITLRISPNPKLVADHYQLYLKNQKHGLLRIMKELLENGKALANLIDEPIERRPFYYPSYFGDIASQSRKHYNLKQAKGLALARESKIEALRKLNNEVKRCLIEQYVPLRSTVLDLACGHGQDILKYSEKKLTRFVGIDISPEEIREAGRRLNADKFTVSCPWQFFVGNLLQERSYQPIKDIIFDVVSLQLAIHYCMATEKQANDLFAQISKHLKPGGIFIGSTGDCQTIAERISKGVNLNSSVDTPPSLWFGNPVYKATFSLGMMERICGVPLTLPQPDDSTSDIPLILCSDTDILAKRLNLEWGIKYTFWLTEHINADEYVVPWAAFCQTASKYGLEIILSERFDRFFANQLNTSRRLQQWKNTQLERIRFDEWQGEAFSFYKVFAFKKVVDFDGSIIRDDSQQFLPLQSTFSIPSIQTFSHPDTLPQQSLVQQQQMQHQMQQQPQLPISIALPTQPIASPFIASVGPISFSPTVQPPAQSAFQSPTLPTPIFSATVPNSVSSPTNDDDESDSDSDDSSGSDDSDSSSDDSSSDT